MVVIHFRAIDLDLNAVFLQLRSRANAREHEDLRGPV